MKNLSEVFTKEVVIGELSISSVNGFIILNNGGENVMYDEKSTLKLYEDSIPKFKGDSLVVGLGLGLLGYNYADECDSFDYLEIDQGVIDLIKPYHSNCNYFQGDAFQWNTDKKYDAIFIDIHHRVTDTLEGELLVLEKRFRKFLKIGGVIKHLKIGNK